MNASMKPTLIHVLVLFLFSVFLTVSVFADPIVSIDPSSLDVTAGQAFTVDVSISSVIDLFAFQFDLGFDPTILSAAGIGEGGFLSGGGSTFFIPGTIDNTAGTIDFTANSLLGAISGVDGSGILATASFTGLAQGVSPINLFNVTLLDSSLSGIDVTTQAGSVNVAPGAAVPEPSTLLLLGTGLIGLQACSHTKKSRKR
jgi:general secretion pathway protein D